MRPNPTHTARYFVVGLICMLISAPVFAIELDGLMALLATNKGGKVNFIEKKYIANLSQTLESSGELVFIPPHRLERHTVAPKQESIILDKNSLTWSRGKTQRELSLSEYPELSVLVTSIRASLSGDKANLEQHYKITLEGTHSAWKLGLTPKLHRAALKVRHIQIAGSQQFAQTIDFALADGDYATMFISKPNF